MHLDVVKEAERRLSDTAISHEYLPIEGLQTFIDKSLQLAYGEAAACLQAGRVAAVQTLSGTGMRCFPTKGGFDPTIG